MTSGAPLTGVSVDLARASGPHRAEAIRDMPARCLCRWTWNAARHAWIRFQATTGCPWHRTGDTT